MWALLFGCGLFGGGICAGRLNGGPHGGRRFLRAFLVLPFAQRGCRALLLFELLAQFAHVLAQQLTFLSLCPELLLKYRAAIANRWWLEFFCNQTKLHGTHEKLLNLHLAFGSEIFWLTEARECLLMFVKHLVLSRDRVLEDLYSINTVQRGPLCTLAFIR